MIILATTTIAIFLTNAKTAAVRRWAPVVALIGQPFWMWKTWRAGETELFLTSIVITLFWCWGLWNHWRISAPPTHLRRYERNRKEIK